MYRTKAREAIIEYLKSNSDKRFTAKEIFDELKKDIDGLNRTTIYRNLERLCVQGELLRFKEPNQDSWYYQYTEGSEHCDKHMHAQCSQCGKIFHLEDEFVNEFENKLNAIYGLNIDSSQSIIIAKCKDCNKSDK